MPISINNVSNILSRATYCIENPNLPVGVLIEEIPSDIGRTYQSYKRGGKLEGLERFFRETLSACVWMFGIPAFNWLGKQYFERVKHLPMNMDYSDKTIHDTVNFLKTGYNPKNLDTSELKQYASMKIKEGSVEEVAKSVKTCKGISIIAATLLNCAMMGFVIPKFNQKLTKRRIEKQLAKKTAIKKQSLDEYKNKTSNKQVSFTGNFLQSASALALKFPYYAENNNTVRLISTDIPTLTGRALTSRNKYEALENTIIDGASIYLYNFCAHNLRDAVCSKAKIPIINPLAYKEFAHADEDLINSVFEKVKNSDKSLSLTEMFDKQTADKLYDLSSFGKYSKINRYVTPEKIKETDSQIFNFFKTVSSKLKSGKDGKIDIKEFRKLTRNYNIKSTGALAIGFIVAILGLSTIMPKIAFKVTTLLTGKNEFTGIAHFTDDSDKDKNVTKS